MWSTLGPPEKGMRRFVASNLLTQELKILPKDDMYEFLSFPVHSMKPSVFDDLHAGRRRGGIIFDIGYTYDQRQLEFSFNTLMAVLAFSSRLFIHLFRKFFPATLPIDTSDASLIQFLRDMPNKYSRYPDVLESILARLG